MKTKNLLLNIVLFATCGSLLQAAPSPEEIIDQHIKAIGGEAAFKKLKTRHVEASMEMPAQGLKASINIYSKAPDKTLSVIEIPNIGTISEGYDGKVAWSKNPFIGVMEKQGASKEMAARQADFYRDVELKERYSSWEYAGTETVNGRKTHVLKATSTEGTEETLYIGTEDYLMRQMSMPIPTENGTISSKMVFDDYRKVDGITMPYSIKLAQPAEAAFEMKIEKVEHDVDIADSKFAKPSN